MRALQQTREENGLTIAHLGGYVRRVSENSYVVGSQSGNGEYQIISGELGWICSCPDHMYRAQKCKHIYAVQFSLELRKTVAKTITINEIKDNVSCVRCHADKSQIVKDSIRKNKTYQIQRYKCKVCGKRFSFNIGFENCHASPQMITTAMQLYYSGESLRNVQKFLALQGLMVTHQTVYNWIKRYVTLMQGYLDKITPHVSGTWRTDELYFKAKGNPKYLYALMDDETRFWISAQVSDRKYTENVRPLFAEGKRIAGKKPDRLISDGAPNFHDAYLKEYWSRIPPRTTHIRHVHMANDHNNNKMERMNGEIRDREKVMRGLKKADSIVLNGYQQYHNYFRQHEGLNGKTPAEAAGIKIQGRNKWVTVIENASTTRQKQ